MAVNLIGPDIKLMRKRYDEALELQGIPAKYQYPLMAASNNQGESVVEALSDPQDIRIFFDGTPKVKTFKRYGWVVANDEALPFLIHCSFHLEHLQKDAVFTLSGQYSELPDRVFKVTEITYDLQAPDHLVCQVIPVYQTEVTGRNSQETKRQFSKSNYFLRSETDYRGDPYTTKEETHR